MKKIIVIGCPGSGKTTFSEKLFYKTGIKLFHLDSIWHKPDKTHISREEFDKHLDEILSLDSWIIDGNYGRTMERRMAVCDTVILFDLPIDICLSGAIARLGKKRSDIPWCENELDADFKLEIEGFVTKNLPGIYGLIDKYKTQKAIVIFKSREQADEYISRIETENKEV